MSYHPRNGATDDWYKQAMRATAEIAVDENYIANSVKDHYSPSGRYHLTVCEYHSIEHPNLHASRGKVFDREELIAEIVRNDDRFWFCWVENHLSGHDYLLCGEHYQGQTVIALDIRKKVDYTPKQSVLDDNAMIYAGYFPSPDNQYIVLDGCYWACPWILQLCDFREPLSLPWPIIAEVIDGIPVRWTDKGFYYFINDEAFWQNIELKDAENTKHFLWLPTGDIEELASPLE